MTHTLQVLTAPFRRIARLVASLVMVAAGLFYAFFPPNTATSYLDTSAFARAWGIFLLFGGVLCAWSWVNRVLVVDRIGLTFLLIGLTALSVVQTMVMFDQPVTWTRGGGTLVYWAIVGYLLARWQDVYHMEREAKAAIRATDEIRGSGQDASE